MTRYISLAEYFWLAEQVTGIDAAVIIKSSRTELADSALHAPQAAFGGEMIATGNGPACAAVDGVVGSDATWIETTDRTGTVRRRVEAPVGVVVVGVPADRHVTIRVFDHDNHELGSHTSNPESFDELPLGGMSGHPSARRISMVLSASALNGEDGDDARRTWLMGVDAVVARSLFGRR